MASKKRKPLSSKPSVHNVRQRQGNLRMAWIPWRKAVIAEALRLMDEADPVDATTHARLYERLVTQRMDMLEAVLLLAHPDGSFLYLNDEAGTQQTSDGPFEVDDAVLLMIGPRHMARKAAKGIFGASRLERYGHLDALLAKPALIDTFEFRS